MLYFGSSSVHPNDIFEVSFNGQMCPEAYLGYGRQGTCHGRHWQGAFGSFGYQHFRIDTFLLILTYVYIKKIMSMKPNPKEINIILNNSKGA
jgi:hypothetical protein